MTEVNVCASLNYKVSIGEGIFDNLGDVVLKTVKPCKMLIVSDENVAPLYLKKVARSLENSGYKVFSAVLPAGETTKSLDNFAFICELCAKNNLTRKDCLIALGGGVIGDLVGFSASAYMRGIKFIQLPTSFLAAIDSSVGGKTAINIKEGKNLVGAFYQPVAVFYDVKTFETLPHKEILCGLGEAIKYAVLCGGEIYDILFSGLTGQNLERLVELCVSAKADIVKKDERENGCRKLLNLGHTIAHSIEKLSGFTASHGVAVAKGLYMIISAQYRHGEITGECYNKIVALLEKYQFDLSVDFSVSDIVREMAFDKKSSLNGIDVVKVKNLGNCITEFMTFKQIEEFLL